MENKNKSSILDKETLKKIAQTKQNTWLGRTQPYQPTRQIQRLIKEQPEQQKFDNKIQQINDKLVQLQQKRTKENDNVQKQVQQNVTVEQQVDNIGQYKILKQNNDKLLEKEEDSKKMFNVIYSCLSGSNEKEIEAQALFKQLTGNDCTEDIDLQTFAKIYIIYVISGDYNPQDQNITSINDKYQTVIGISDNIEVLNAYADNEVDFGLLGKSHMKNNFFQSKEKEETKEVDEQKQQLQEIQESLKNIINSGKITQVQNTVEQIQMKFTELCKFSKYPRFDDGDDGDDSDDSDDGDNSDDGNDGDDGDDKVNKDGEKVLQSIDQLQIANQNIYIPLARVFIEKMTDDNFLWEDDLFNKYRIIVSQHLIKAFFKKQITKRQQEDDSKNLGPEKKESHKKEDDLFIQLTNNIAIANAVGKQKKDCQVKLYHAAISIYMTDQHKKAKDIYIKSYNGQITQKEKDFLKNYEAINGLQSSYKFVKIDENVLNFCYDNHIIPQWFIIKANGMYQNVGAFICMQILFDGLGKKYQDICRKIYVRMLQIIIQKIPGICTDSEGNIGTIKQINAAIGNTKFQNDTQQLIAQMLMNEYQLKKGDTDLQLKTIITLLTLILGGKCRMLEGFRCLRELIKYKYAAFGGEDAKKFLLYAKFGTNKFDENRDKYKLNYQFQKFNDRILKFYGKLLNQQGSKEVAQLCRVINLQQEVAVNAYNSKFFIKKSELCKYFQTIGQLENIFIIRLNQIHKGIIQLIQLPQINNVRSGRNSVDFKYLSKQKREMKKLIIQTYLTSYRPAKCIGVQFECQILKQTENGQYLLGAYRMIYNTILKGTIKTYKYGKKSISQLQLNPTLLCLSHQQTYQQIQQLLVTVQGKIIDVNFQILSKIALKQIYYYNKNISQKNFNFNNEDFKLIKIIDLYNQIKKQYKSTLIDEAIKRCGYIQELANIQKDIEDIYEYFAQKDILLKNFDNKIVDFFDINNQFYKGFKFDLDTQNLFQFIIKMLQVTTYFIQLQIITDTGKYKLGNLQNSRKVYFDNQKDDIVLCELELFQFYNNDEDKNTYMGYLFNDVLVIFENKQALEIMDQVQDENQKKFLNNKVLKIVNKINSSDPDDDTQKIITKNIDQHKAKICEGLQYYGSQHFFKLLNKIYDISKGINTVYVECRTEFFQRLLNQLLNDYQNYKDQQSIKGLKSKYLIRKIKNMVQQKQEQQPVDVTGQNIQQQIQQNNQHYRGRRYSGKRGHSEGQKDNKSIKYN